MLQHELDEEEKRASLAEEQRRARDEEDRLRVEREAAEWAEQLERNQAALNQNPGHPNAGSVKFYLLWSVA